MDQEGNGHGGSRDPSLPQSGPRISVWPYLVAGAVLILGLALFWARGEDNTEVTVPVVAGAVVLLVAAAAAWALDGRILAPRTREEERQKELAARHTQVITFLVAGDQLEAARADGGILTELERAEGELRAHRGFTDLRIAVTAVEEGPSQALVETVWASREDLAGYDSARGSLLDLLGEAGDQVVPGSVQAFDMDVVRDIKERPPRFTMVHGIGALAALVVGGFVVGLAGIGGNGTPAAADGDGGNGAADPFLVVATDNKFDKSTLSAAPDTEVTFTLRNDGAILHNIAFYDAKGGALLSEESRGEFIEGGIDGPLTFTTPGPGEYYFQCDLHPTEMSGTFTIVEGGPGGTSGGTGDGTADVIAHDIEFNVEELTATAGQEYSVTFENQGEILHNLAFLTGPNGDPVADGAVGEIVEGGESYTLTFVAPAAGEYTFICQIHPDQMVGKFIVQ